MTGQQTPPHSLRAERSVLSAMMAYPDLVPEAMELVDPSSLHSMAHQAVWDAIAGLRSAGYVTSSDSVIERLTQTERISDAGGPKAVLDIAATPGSKRDLAENARTIAETAALRRFATAGRAIWQAGMDGGNDPAKVFIESNEAIDAAMSGRLGGNVVMASDGVAAHRLTADKPMETVPTGFAGLDDLMGGYVKGYLNLVGAPSGGGKTSFMAQSIVAACLAGRPVLFQSLEMTTGEVYDRLASQIGMVPLWKITQKRMTSTERERRDEAYDTITSWPLAVDETKQPTVSAMSLNARAVERSYGDLGVVFFDYLQYWHPPVANVFSREGEVAAAGHLLNDFADKFKAPVVAGVQLNNKVADRADKRPTMWDIRESSAPYHDAAAVIFLYREGHYNRSMSGPEANFTEIILDKQRNGPTDTVYADWIPERSMLSGRPNANSQMPSRYSPDGLSPADRLRAVTVTPHAGDDGAADITQPEF